MQNGYRNKVIILLVRQYIQVYKEIIKDALLYIKENIDYFVFVTGMDNTCTLREIQ